MKTILSIFTLIAIIILVPFDANAQSDTVLKLNTLENNGLSLAKTADNSRVFYNINEETFTHPDFKKGANVEFSGLEADPVRLVLKRVTSYTPGTISIIAARADDPESQMIATYAEGRFNGLWHEKPGKTLHLGYDTSLSKSYLAKHSAENIDHVQCGIEGEDLVALPDYERSFGSATRAKSSGGTVAGAPLIAAAEDDSVTIDLMLVYTNAAADWANTSQWGNIQVLLGQAVNLSQAALDNSQIEIELRLVNTTNTDYDEENDEVDSNARLRRFTQNPASPVFGTEYNGFMEDIHTIRNQVGADIVSLIAFISDTGGLGWRLSSSSGSSQYGFNLNRVQQIGSGYTLIHEIGHNMGNAHSRTQLSSASDDAGGVFQYSVGYQNPEANFHTVIAYDDGLNQAPLFSSPNLTFQGEPAGSIASPLKPVDNARSMAQIKRAVSRYRQSVQDAPVIGVESNDLAVQMNREDEINFPFTISNSGDSPLVWDVDFTFPQALKASTAKEKSNRPQMAPADLSGITAVPSNYSGNYFKGKAAEEEILYETSFESGEGFSPGDYIGYNEWRSVSGSEFSIESGEGRTGANSLRLSYDAEANSSQFVSAPFFGYQLFGKYEITVNFRVSSTSETFDFYLFDGKTGEFSAGAIIANGTFYAADLDEMNELTFYGTNAVVVQGVYAKLTMVLNTTNQTVDYYFNNMLVSQNAYVGGISPGELQVLHRNDVSGTYMDIDDIEIKKVESPYEWLQVPQPTGVSFEEGSANVNLVFNTEGVAAGTYETDMMITSNDPSTPTVTIPITLTVADQVSNETEERPESISLDQNYPNPFNPSTTISYSLNTPGEVTLEVFTIQGRKVATLERGNKSAGEHQVTFDAANLSSGIYLYRLQTAGQTLTRQMVLIK